MYYVSRYRGAPSYCQDTEDIIEQSILTGYMNLRLIKSLVKRGSLVVGGASGGGGGAGGGGGSGKWLGVFSFFLV